MIHGPHPPRCPTKWTCFVERSIQLPMSELPTSHTRAMLTKQSEKEDAWQQPLFRKQPHKSMSDHGKQAGPLVGFYHSAGRQSANSTRRPTEGFKSTGLKIWPHGCT